MKDFLDFLFGKIKKVFIRKVDRCEIVNKIDINKIFKKEDFKMIEPKREIIIDNDDGVNIIARIVLTAEEKITPNRNQVAQVRAKLEALELDIENYINQYEQTLENKNIEINKVKAELEKAEEVIAIADNIAKAKLDNDVL